MIDYMYHRNRHYDEFDVEKFARIRRYDSIPHIVLGVAVTVVALWLYWVLGLTSPDVLLYCMLVPGTLVFALWVYTGKLSFREQDRRNTEHYLANREDIVAVSRELNAWRNR